jgi:hypothetical protein
MVSSRAWRGEGNTNRERENHKHATIETARCFWSEGLSTAEIGRRMGVTKNVIVGIARRNGFPARPSPIRRAG